MRAFERAFGEQYPAQDGNFWAVVGDSSIEGGQKFDVRHGPTQKY